MLQLDRLLILRAGAEAVQEEDGCGVDYHHHRASLLLLYSGRRYLWHFLPLPLGVGSLALQQQFLVGYIDDASRAVWELVEYVVNACASRCLLGGHPVVIGFRR